MGHARWNRPLRHAKGTRRWRGCCNLDVRFTKSIDSGQYPFVVRYGYYVDSHIVAIINWHTQDKLPTERGNFPVALCGNKTDLPYRRLGPGSITFHREKGLQYNDISVKEGYNLIRPFLFLAKRILHDPSLVRSLCIYKLLFRYLCRMVIGARTGESWNRPYLTSAFGPASPRARRARISPWWT